MKSQHYANVSSSGGLPCVEYDVLFVILWFAFPLTFPLKAYAEEEEKEISAPGLKQHYIVHTMQREAKFSSVLRCFLCSQVSKLIKISITEFSFL